MRSEVRRKLEMATRVREFNRAHPSTEAGYVSVLSRFEERLTHAEAIVARQHSGLELARGASSRRRDLRRILHFQLVRYLVAVGAVAVKDRAELVEQFRLPDSSGSNAKFLTTVKALLASAEGQKDLLVGAGMNPALLKDLSTLLASFEALSEAARTARRDHIGARVDLESFTTDMMEQIRVLDGMARYRFAKEPEVLAEWNAARHIPGTPVEKAAPAPTPSGDGTTPPTPGSVSPAA